MIDLVYLFVCLSVCLFVCWSNYSKGYRQICMIFWGSESRNCLKDSPPLQRGIAQPLAEVMAPSALVLQMHLGAHWFTR